MSAETSGFTTCSQALEFLLTQFILITTQICEVCESFYFVLQNFSAKFTFLHAGP